MAKSVIYETRGRAREYCELAINLYTGCPHGCRYCYAPGITRRKREAFHSESAPRVTVDEIQVSAASREGEKRPVLLCFMTDPYQPQEEERLLTRATINALHDYDLSFTVLTKAGRLARRDFELYREGDSFGATLTSLDESRSREWEPGAGSPEERIQNLYIARMEHGIPTWISLEPVLRPTDSLAVIHGCAPFVDHFKLGKLNYDVNWTIEQKTDWAGYAEAAISALRRQGKGFYIKRDLGKYIGHPEGLREGRQLP